MQIWLQKWIMNYVDGDPAPLVGNDEGTESRWPPRSASRRKWKAILGTIRQVLPASRTISSKGLTYHATRFETAVGEGELTAFVRFGELDRSIEKR
jgi:hypothetical protein